MEVTVQAGDSLWKYSQLYGIPLAVVEDSNPGVNVSALQLGQTVQIPGYRSIPRTIQSGDTLWALASAQGLPVAALLPLNPGVQPGVLAVGQQVLVPQRVSAPVVNVALPYTFAAMQEDLAQLTAIYPFLQERSIGTSVLGKPLQEVTLGRGVLRVQANGSIHANEWITTPVLMRFINDYALAVTSGGRIRGRELLPLYLGASMSVVPMLNPDGVDLVIEGPPADEAVRSEVLAINGGSTDFSGWKANIRGVDLNNQFPARWELEAAQEPSAPAPRDYPGPAPLSEPESQAIAELTRQGDFARALALHTQGAVIFWGFLGLQPPESAVLAAEFARVSGYAPIENTPDSYAGYKDWFIQDWRRPGFTLELGRGVNPLPLSQLNQIYEETLGILLASLSG